MILGARQFGQPIELISRRMFSELQAVKDARARDHLRVSGKILCAVALHTELMELPESARLRLFIAIAGGQIIRLDGQGIVVQPMLEECPRRTGCSLGTQGDAVAALGQEGVHLLLHDIGGIADAALKKVGVLEHRRPHFLIAECPCLVAEQLF